MKLVFEARNGMNVVGSFDALTAVRHSHKLRTKRTARLPQYTVNQLVTERFGGKVRPIGRTLEK